MRVGFPSAGQAGGHPHPLPPTPGPGSGGSQMRWPPRGTTAPEGETTMHFNNIFVFANTFLVFCLFAFQLHMKKFNLR